MKAHLGLLVAIVMLGVVPIGWRRCVKIVFFLVVFEGAIRKWVLPQASELVYFAKDFFIGVAYLKYFVSLEGKQSIIARDPTVSMMIWCASLYVALEGFNVHLGSVAVGLVGIRNYLWYIPLMFLTQNLFRTQEEFGSFLRWHLLYVIPLMVLALYQHNSPPDSWINQYASGDRSQIAMIGSAVRVTASFSYLAGYAAYLQTMAALVIPLLLVEQPKQWRLALTAIAVSTVVSMFLTGSRGPIMTFAIFLAGYFAFNKVLRALGLYRKFILPILFGVLVFSAFLDVVFDSLVGRFSGDQDMSRRVIGMLFQPFRYASFSGIFGYGSGATYQAANMVRLLLGLPPGDTIPVPYESEPERIMLELGPIGFSLWYALRLVICRELWSTYVKLESPLLRELALSAFLLHLISLPSQTVFQITFMVYYWFTAGFIFLLPQLEVLDGAFKGLLTDREERSGGMGPTGGAR